MQLFGEYLLNFDRQNCSRHQIPQRPGLPRQKCLLIKKEGHGRIIFQANITILFIASITILSLLGHHGNDRNDF